MLYLNSTEKDLLQALYDFAPFQLSKAELFVLLWNFSIFHLRSKATWRGERHPGNTILRWKMVYNELILFVEAHLLDENLINKFQFFPLHNLLSTRLCPSMPRSVLRYWINGEDFRLLATQIFWSENNSKLRTWEDHGARVDYGKLNKKICLRGGFAGNCCDDENMRESSWFELFWLNEMRCLGVDLSCLTEFGVNSMKHSGNRLNVSWMSHWDEEKMRIELIEWMFVGFSWPWCDSALSIQKSIRLETNGSLNVHLVEARSSLNTFSPWSKVCEVFEWILKDRVECNQTDSER